MGSTERRLGNVAFLAAGRYHSARKLTSVWRCRDGSRDEDAGSPRVQVAGPRRRVDRRRTFLRPPRHWNHTSWQTAASVCVTFNSHGHASQSARVIMASGSQCASHPASGAHPTCGHPVRSVILLARAHPVYWPVRTAKVPLQPLSRQPPHVTRGRLSAVFASTRDLTAFIRGNLRAATATQYLCQPRQAYPHEQILGAYNDCYSKHDC